MENTRIRILIADDQPHVRKGLQALIETDDRFILVGVASNGLQAVDLAFSQDPDTILMDSHMPYLDGIEATHQIRAAKPNTRVILMITEGEPHIPVDLLPNEIHSYILKSKPEIDLLEQIIRLSSDRS